jgi:hypothetical protein
MRVLKALDRNASGKERRTSVMPLSKAKVTVADVRAFWSKQDFDLQLMSHEGNCDLCFLKGRGKRAELVRRTPSMADWWIEQERSAPPYKNGNRFIKGEPYDAHRANVVSQPMMDFAAEFAGEPDDEGCGDVCGGED